MSPERRQQFLLALRLGYANPDRMLEDMPWRVWKEWNQYYEADPYEQTREDYMLAQIAMLIANAWLRPKGHAPFTTDEFMPKFKNKTTPRSEVEQTEHLLSLAKDLTFLWGGEIDYGNRNQAGESNHNAGSQN